VQVTALSGVHAAGLTPVRRWRQRPATPRLWPLTWNDIPGQGRAIPRFLTTARLTPPRIATARSFNDCCTAYARSASRRTTSRSIKSVGWPNSPGKPLASKDGRTSWHGNAARHLSYAEPATTPSTLQPRPRNTDKTAGEPVTGKLVRQVRRETTRKRTRLTADTSPRGRPYITRFQPLLDQLDDLRDTVVTLDALHCQRDHVTYLAERGAHWIVTVKANQPSLHAELAALPWQAVPQATRHADRGHGRREIRTLKILTVATGIGFPHAAQALQIRRRRRRLDQPNRFTTETVYAITDLRVQQARPAELAAWIRGHWSIENKLHWVRDVTYDEDRSQIRTRSGPQVMAVLRNAAIGILRLTGVANIAAANRHHARDSTRPLALLGIT
jgi:predicted transposase YbfD/YdcC